MGFGIWEAYWELGPEILQGRDSLEKLHEWVRTLCHETQWQRRQIHNEADDEVEEDEPDSYSLGNNIMDKAGGAFFDTTFDLGTITCKPELTKRIAQIATALDVFRLR